MKSNFLDNIDSNILAPWEHTPKLKHINECTVCEYNKKYDGHIVVCNINSTSAVVIPRPVPEGLGKTHDRCVECPEKVKYVNK